MSSQPANVPPTLANIDAQLQELLEWQAKRRNVSRESCKKYYEQNYKVKEDMTLEQKQQIQDKIDKRKTYYHNKYEANKDQIKARVKEYKEQKKQLRLAVQPTAQQPIQPDNISTVP
jgi:hypothetical protein